MLIVTEEAQFVWDSNYYLTTVGFEQKGRIDDVEDLG